MSTEAQLQWEARWARPAALAAFAAGLMLVAGTGLLLSIPQNRPAIVQSRPNFLLSVNDSPGSLIAAVGLQAAAALCLIFAFYYLFRATIHRSPQIPRWFVYLVFLGPAMYAVAQVIGVFTQIDVAETFADGSYSFPDADPSDTPNLRQCPAIRGDLGDACAEELLRNNSNGGAVALGLAGSVATAFLFVMLPLRARRAGLMSPFMSILGVIAGILFVLPLLPGVPTVLQAFWLGALGLLYLGRWPGGRGPAWESGEEEPWPGAAVKRGRTQASNGDEHRGEAEPEPAALPGAGPEPEPGAEPESGAEPERERPASRKRKRKRR
ncbi:MAG TPA: hypothetical protein VI122_00145 [Thermoleophilaceae bacterium]